MNFLNEVKAECKKRIFAVYSDLSCDLEAVEDMEEEWRVKEMENENTI